MSEGFLGRWSRRKQAGRAGQEKQRQQALAMERMVNELKAGQLPAEFAPLLPQLLYK